MKVQFILYVADQKKSTTFYSKLLFKEPSLVVEGMTEFTLSESTKLGLMPNKGIATLFPKAIPNPSEASHVPKCELYLEVNFVDASYKQAIELGATPINPPQKRDWGDYVGYVMDLDAHIIAFFSRN